MIINVIVVPALKHLSKIRKSGCHAAGIPFRFAIQ
jgi:hypothetical protein